MGSRYIPSSLRRVVITDETVVSRSAFDQCAMLTNIELNEGVCDIGQWALAWCNLTNMIIPNSVTNMGMGVFACCGKLESVTLPFVGSKRGNSGTSDSLFGYVLGNSSYDGGVATKQYYSSSSYSTFYIPSMLRSVVIMGETVLGYGAFYGCSGLTNVTISYGVTDIGIYAFRDCGGLTSIVVPDSVASIGNRAFYGCSGLTSMELPFVGSERGNSGDGGSLFGYIFGIASYDGSVAAIQYCSDDPSSCRTNYVPVLLKSVTITDETVLGYGAFGGCDRLEHITVPADMTAIGDAGFSGCSNLMSITIPDGVTSIGDYAFYGCGGLSGIMIPDGVEYIGEHAFDGCGGLLYGEDGYIVVNGWVLGYSNSEVTSLVIPDGVVGIGSSAFADFWGLEEVVLPDSLRCIGGGAFDTCTELDNVVIPDSVKIIGDGAFRNCTYMRNLTIPSGVTNIGAFAFSGCSGLMSVSLPAGVAKIESSTFSGCSGLVTIAIPDGVTNIEDYAFAGCSSLEGMTIPESVTNIGSHAFADCGALESVAMPRSVTMIGEEAFSGCNGLNRVHISDLAAWCGISFVSENSNPLTFAHNLYLNDEQITDLRIPDGVTSIGNRVFQECYSVTNVTIPNSVRTIGEYAFNGCIGLNELVVPTSVTSINKGCFMRCANLVRMTLPFVGSMRGNSGTIDSLFGYVFGMSSYVGGMATRQYYSSSSYSTFYIPSALKTVVITDETKIGYGAFYGCSGLISVSMPNSLISIEYAAFSGCISMEDMKIPFIGNKRGVQEDGYDSFCDGRNHFGYVFGRSNTNGMEKCVQRMKYKRTHGYYHSYYYDYEDVGLEIHTTAHYADSEIHRKETIIEEIEFFLPQNLTDVEISDETAIGYGVMSGCKMIKTIKIGGSLSSISKYAFLDCSAIERIEINVPNLTYIDSYAMARCSNLCELCIPFSNNDINSTAFYQCDNIRRIVIPECVASIKDYAFYNCSWLTNVTIGSGVTRIGIAAFQGCNGLISVTMPDSVRSVGDRAFEGCVSLGNVELPRELDDLGGNDFRVVGRLSDGKSGLWIQDGWLMGYVGEVSAEVTVPEGITGIASYAFEGQTGLARVRLPSTLKYIGVNAFMGCTALEEIEIPDSVEKIDGGAFKNCTWLQDLMLPQNLKVIGKEAFANCAMLPNLVCADGLETIGEQAFSNCWRMLSVSLPVSVTNIGDNAFVDCKRLTGLRAPTHIKSFETLFPSAYSNISTVVVSDGEWMLTKDVFKGCKALSDIVLPSTITQMCASAFENCTALSAVVLPDEIESVGDGAFRGCVALEDVKLPRALKVIGDSAFRGCTALARLDLPNMVEDIGAYAFYGDSRLADFNLPRSLKRVGNYAFYNCTMMAEACFADGLLYLGTNAYQNCTSVKVVYIPSSVTALGTSIFAGCSSITNITTATAHQTTASLFPSVYNKLPRILIAPGETRICASCFTNCTAMTEIGLPDSVTTMGASAFSGCTRLSRVSLSSRLAALPDYAFKNCTSLATLTIPESVTSLGKNVFEGCSSLESLYFVGDAPTYNAAVFSGIASGVTVFVVNGSMGWDGVATSRALPDSWPTSNSREITYWEPNRFDVVFDANGGAPATNVLEEITGMTYTLPTVNPSMPGATFLGWWTEPVNGAQVTAGTQVTLTRAHTFYAHWAGNLYHVVFDANGGMGDMADQTYVVGEPTELPLNVFAKPGFAFVGWSLARDEGLIFNDGAIVEDLTLESDATVTLYAVWDEQAWATGDYMNAPGRMFVSGGDAEWTNDVVICHDGIGSMRSGEIGLDGESSLSTTVVGAGVVSFWWKVSCEETYKTDRYDYVTFSVDGVERDWIAGEVDWTNAVFEVIGSGSHVLTWRYHKDDWDEPGYECEDCAWVDEFCWSPAAVTATFDGNGNTAGVAPKDVVKWEGYSLTIPGAGTLEKFSFVFAGWSDGKGVYAPGTIYVFTDKDISFSAVWTEKVWTYADFLNTTNLLLTTSVGMEWVGDFVTNHDWVASMRSAAIGDGQSSWLQGTVTGRGTLSFWAKVSGETRRGRLYDYLCVTVDGEEVYSAADVDWTNVVIDITSPDTHTIRWTYLKDTSNSVGYDCAWIDEVGWMPNVDQIPAVAVDADVATVNATVDGVGFADATVKTAIGGSAAEYDAFKTWADGVKGVTGDLLAGEAAVVANEHAAAAYLLGAERLFENEPTVEIGELAIGEGESAGTTAMTVAVTVKDGESAVAVNAAKVAAMFEATSDLGDWTGAAKLTPTVTTSGTDASGKMTFVVTPGDGTAAKAFLRIRK